MKIKINMKVKVCIGSGLDSERKGTVLNSKLYSQSFIKNNEPGRCYPFDNKKESLIMDDAGNIFTMFNNRLIILE